MDGRHFDALAKQVGSRRTAIGALLAGALFPLDAIARKKGKGTSRKGKAPKRARIQAEPCWRAGACIVSKGSNVSQCDLDGYTAPQSLDCTRCNLSRANLRDADLTGVNFTRANLSGACLVNADFTDATFANSTNLSNAIFCNTRMPNGSINNSGCGSGTACCQTTCTAGTCESLNACGANVADGCGGILSCGTCGLTATPICASGTCVSCASVCTTECGCAGLPNGTTQCFGDAILRCTDPCTTDAQCATGDTCVSTIANPITGVTRSAPASCDQTSVGVCVNLSSCGAG